MTPLDAAIDYINRGWSPVPIPYRRRKPVLKDWPDLRITAETAPQYFNGARQNVGVILGGASNGLTDIDLDCPEAVAVAPWLLPPTKAIFGRETAPDSHWLYVSEAGRRDVFRDPALTDDRNMLVEIRRDAHQTVFPGSAHEHTGETIDWTRGCAGEPAVVETADLRKRVGRLAAAALLARTFPARGGRHDYLRDVGCFLHRAGFTEREAEIFIEAVARAGGSDDPVGHARNCSRVREGSNVAGFPRLAELIGEARAKAVAGWIGYPEATDTAGGFEWWGSERVHEQARAADGSEPVAVVDIFAELPPPRFDPSSVPQVIADFAESKYLATGADRAGFALAAVIACSAAIHPQGRLVLTPGDANRWAVPAALWGLAVGPPSAGKDAALKASVEGARARYKDLLQAWKVERAILAGKLRAEGESERDVARALADKLPAPPMTETADCTVEALQEQLARPEQDGHGILVHAAEASSFLLRMESPGQQGARGAWLQFYDCVSDYSRMRVSTGNTTVPVWGGSIFLGIQPTVFAKLNAAMSLESDGMIQRMIPVLMARKQLRQPGQANEAAAALVTRRCAMIYERGPVECHLSAAAAETYRAFEVELDGMIATDPVSPAFGSWLGKLFGMWGRIALTFHHLAAPGAAPTIDNAVAEQATRFVWRFVLPHALRFYDEIGGGGGEMDDARAIGEWLLQKQHEAGGGELKLDLRTFLSGPRATRKIGADATRKKLDLLVSAGWLVERFPDPKAARWRSTHWIMPAGISRSFEARREAYMRSLAAVRDKFHG